MAEAKSIAAKPAAAKGKKVEKKGKPKKYSYYKIEGGSVKRTRKSCPKCGGGVFMAQHKDRVNCGKCGYTEHNVKQ